MEIKLDFTVEECNLILKALGELPAKESIVMINKISSEAQKQLKEQEKKDVKNDKDS